MPWLPFHNHSPEVKGSSADIVYMLWRIDQPVDSV